MKSLSVRLLATISMFLAASHFCVAQDLFFNAGFFKGFEPAPFNLLQKLQPKQTIGEYPIVPVSQNLGFVKSSVTTTTNGAAFGNATFFDIRDGMFAIGMLLKANLQQTNSPDWTDEPCKRTNFLWERSTGGQFTNVNCASINHVTKFRSSPSGPDSRLFMKIREIEPLDFPPTIVRIKFTRYTRSSRRLEFTIDVNPETFGIDRESESNWGINGWYKDFIHKDVKKTEFLKKLSQWASLVQDRMDDAFEKRPDAFDGIPDLESYLNGSKRL